MQAARRTQAEVVKDALGHDLCTAVAALGLEWAGLRDGDVRRDAVHGCRRRVHEAGTAVRVHDL